MSKLIAAGSEVETVLQRLAQPDAFHRFTVLCVVFRKTKP